MKRVLILTLPPSHNYGGILQAYALQEFVRRLGFDVTTTANLIPNIPLRSRVIGTFKSLLNRNSLNLFSSNTQRQRYLEPRSFIQRKINSIEVNPRRIAQSVSDHNLQYDAIIIGSDQVWRPSYGDIGAFFGEGMEEISSTVFSYAASFGLSDSREFDEDLVERVSTNLRHFTGISVRETSGVEIVKDLWGLDADFHLDPTLLLPSGDYSELLDSENITPDGSLFVYLLDQDSEKMKIAKTVGHQLDARLHDFYLENKACETHHSKVESLPSVEKWLEGFAKARFVVTDSFHGAVFSIIFRRPFVVVNNQGRGTARFESLLKKLGLEDRLIEDINQLADLPTTPIDWSMIENLLTCEIMRSQQYLRERLGI